MTTPSDALTATRVRDVLGHFATGVTVVTTLDADGAPAGTTASAVSSLSLDPPLLLVCLGRDSATLRALGDHGHFAVNVLAAAQAELSTRFARSGGDASWADVVHAAGRSGVPRLDGALAVLECELHDRADGGDHEIVVGRVVAVRTPSDGDARPLLHFRGRYAELAA